MKIFQFRFNIQDFIFDALMILFMYGVIQTDLFYFLLGFSMETAILVILLVIVAMTYHITLFWYNILQFLPQKKRETGTVLHFLFALFSALWYVGIALNFSSLEGFDTDNNLFAVFVIILVSLYAITMGMIASDSGWKETIRTILGIGLGIPLMIFFFFYIPYLLGDSIAEITGWDWLGWITGVAGVALMIYVFIRLVRLWHYVDDKISKNKERLKPIASLLGSLVVNFFIVVVVFYFEFTYDMLVKKNESVLLMLFFYGVLPARIAHLLGKPVQIGNLISLVVFLVLLITNL